MIGVFELNIVFECIIGVFVFKIVFEYIVGVLDLGYMEGIRDLWVVFEYMIGVFDLQLCVFDFGILFKVCRIGVLNVFKKFRCVWLLFCK